MIFQNLLKKLAKELDRASVPYMIIGGQAVLLYGEPRLTKDIDVTLGIGIEKMEEIDAVAKNLKLKSLTASPHDFVRDTLVWPFLEPKTGIRVDFIFSFSPYERQAIKRARRVRFGKIVVRFASLEDLIIHKIIAGRERDKEDVRTVVAINPNYNKRYVRRWLAKFDDSLGTDFVETFFHIDEELRDEIQ